MIDAQLLASLANESVYITDQPRARPVVVMVEECAAILGVDAPEVYIKPGGPEVYVTHLREPHVLVLTSGLLDLYDETPDELRFLIGHALGHIKADHLRTQTLGRAVVEAIVPVPTDCSDRSGRRWSSAACSTGSATRNTPPTAGLLCVGGGRSCDAGAPPDDAPDETVGCSTRPTRTLTRTACSLTPRACVNSRS